MSLVVVCSTVTLALAGLTICGARGGTATWVTGVLNEEAELASVGSAGVWIAGGVPCEKGGINLPSAGTFAPSGGKGFPDGA